MRYAIRAIFEYLWGVSNFKYVEQVDGGFLYPIELDFTLQSEEEFYEPKDGIGVPQKKYESVGVQYNPTRVAAYALAHWNRFQTGNQAQSRKKFLLAADWFLGQPEGLFRYHFKWGSIPSGWLSGMAQGEGISVLCRAYVLTKNQAYLDHAIAAASPLMLLQEQGGVRSFLPCGDPFIEEYPGETDKHVLNGFLYALIGLNDLCSIKPERALVHTLEEMVASLIANVDLWDAKGWSLYQPAGKNPFVRNFCTVEYHSLHIAQLTWLYHVTSSEKLRSVISSWESGRDNFSQRARAAIMKIIYRVHNVAQR